MEIIILRKQIGVIAGVPHSSKQCIEEISLLIFFVFLLSYMTRSQMIMQGHSPILLYFSVHTLSEITLALEENTNETYASYNALMHLDENFTFFKYSYYFPDSLRQTSNRDDRNLLWPVRK